MKMDGENGAEEDAASLCNISVLPDEILERIFELLCVYTDYNNCTLVCSRWHRLLHGVAYRKNRSFRLAMTEGRTRWTKLDNSKLKYKHTITSRYFHSSCYVGDSLYVFGGCTGCQTTFNDLWRLDLSTRQWIRLTASGTYPSPKASASMVVWRNQLILFGGWNQPAAFPLHQAGTFFDQLHIYDIEQNNWSVVNTAHGPEPTAGHSYCVMGDRMLIFGGSHSLRNCSNALWEFDLINRCWREIHADIAPIPHPRYGAFMCSINERQAVILGGCGGPNMKLGDCWLVTLINVTGQCTAEWSQLDIYNMECGSRLPLWCLQCCKVGDSIVLLSKTSLPVEADVLCRISHKKTPQKSESGSTSVTVPISSDNDDMRPRLQPTNGATASGTKAMKTSLNSTQMKRKFRLEQLKKFEDRMRERANAKPVKAEEENLLKNPMFIHSLDISSVADGHVTWNTPNLLDVCGEVAEDTLFYTLTQGRNELIMVGGARSEQNQEIQRSASSDSTCQTLNESVYIITSA